MTQTQTITFASIKTFEAANLVFKAFLIGIILETFHKVFCLKKEPLMTRFLATQLAKSHYFNISQAKKDFGYKPLVTTEEGTKRLVNDYFSH